MSEEINSKMIDELLKTIPKQNNQCISTYGSIDVDNLKQVVDKFKKIPNYDELIKINNKLEQALNEIEKNYCNYYGTTKEQNDNDVLRYVLKEISEIINKAKRK